MRRYELDSLSYEKVGTLQVRKEAGGYVYFHWTYPSTYETVKHIICRWRSGVATIPNEWVD